jgi:hypothetical protein
VADCKRIVDTYLVKLFDVDASDVVCVSGPTTVEVPSQYIPLTPGNREIVHQT